MDINLSSTSWLFQGADLPNCSIVNNGTQVIYAFLNGVPRPTDVGLRIEAGKALPTQDFVSSLYLRLNTAGTVPVQIQTVSTGTVPRNAAPRVNMDNVYDYRASFDATIAGGVNTKKVKAIRTGNGMTLAQSAGKLNITSGTTLNSETILRLAENTVIQKFHIPLVWRYAFLLSQRIVNQSFIFELVDIFGDDLAYNATSATAMSINKPAHGLTAEDVGKVCNAGNFGTLLQPSQTVTIASITNADNFVVTAAGLTVGVGTVSLWGFNSIYTIYDGATATSFKVGVRRNGRDFIAGGSSLTSTTTAALMADHIYVTKNNVSFLDAVANVIATNDPRVNRGTIPNNIPDAFVDLICQIRVLNGTVAPASSTTATIDFVSLLDADEPLAVSLISGENASGAPVQTRLSPDSQASITSLPALSTGTNTIGGIFSNASAAAGGVTTNNRLVSSAATTNGTSVKASAGRVYKIRGYNNSAALKYLKLYNKASAPTVGTDVPTHTYALKANDFYEIDIAGAAGYYFATGIAFALTGGSADSDTTALAAGDILGQNIAFL